MDTQTKLTHYILKLVNAKKLASKSILNPKRTKRFNYPRRLRKYQINRFLVQNRNVITFSAKPNTTGKHIVFLHGGAYTVEVKNGHWWLVEQIIKHSDCKLSFIQYPLAPEHNYKHVHALLDEAYSKLTAKNPNDLFYLLGDSAGGGLCLAFAQRLRDRNSPKIPEKTILLSPWLDLSISNPEIKEMEHLDLLLSAEPLQKCGSWYSDGIDLKSPSISPLYGDMKDLKHIGIFVGTDEIFLPDCRKLKTKIEASNSMLFYKEYSDMQHDWIVFPIKERDILLKDIIQYLQS